MYGAASIDLYFYLISSYELANVEDIVQPVCTWINDTWYPRISEWRSTVHPLHLQASLLEMTLKIPLRLPLWSMEGAQQIMWSLVRPWRTLTSQQSFCWHHYVQTTRSLTYRIIYISPNARLLHFCRSSDTCRTAFSRELCGCLEHEIYDTFLARWTDKSL